MINTLCYRANNTCHKPVEKDYMLILPCASASHEMIHLF